MTCASHVQANGKGFSGQLGIFNDQHIPGHTRLAAAISETGSLAVIQLHHAGIRSPKALVDGGPVGPSTHEKTESRALTLTEVHKLRDDFIAAGVRAQQCGYNGVEVHGAHGYIICQFMSSKYNKRSDEYGGSLENRCRLLMEITSGIRTNCGPEFLVGVRLSPERFGMQLTEVKTTCKWLIDAGNIDFLDISLWDVFKEPEEEEHQGKSLLEHFATIDYDNIRWTVAGKIHTGQDVQAVIDAGVDFVTIGRAAILHHDFPEQVRKHTDFTPIALPVTVEYLQNEGVGHNFITYLRRWPGFVAS
jgi:2,4-dienoyl-CoA reductase-like NADH-dependent reductase (Old Yellow Enzyme family)